VCVRVRADDIAPVSVHDGTSPPSRLSASSGAGGDDGAVAAVALPERWKVSVGALLDDFFASGSVSDAVATAEEIVVAFASELRPGGSGSGGSGALSPREMSLDAIGREIVKRCVNVSLDRNQQQQEVAACLLSSLDVWGVITPRGLADGLHAVLGRLDDVVLDVPNAPAVLARMLTHFIADESLDEGVLTQWAGSPRSGSKLQASALAMTTQLLYGRDRIPVVQMRRVIRCIVEESLKSGEPHYPPRRRRHRCYPVCACVASIHAFLCPSSYHRAFYRVHDYRRSVCAGRPRGIATRATLPSRGGASSGPGGDGGCCRRRRHAGAARDCIDATRTADGTRQTEVSALTLLWGFGLISLLNHPDACIVLLCCGCCAVSSLCVLCCTALCIALAGAALSSIAVCARAASSFRARVCLCVTRAGDVVEGFLRLYRSLGRLTVDVPDAVDVLVAFTVRAMRDGALAGDFIDTLRSLVASAPSDARTPSPAAARGPSASLSSEEHHRRVRAAGVAALVAKADGAVADTWGVPTLAHTRRVVSDVVDRVVTGEDPSEDETLSQLATVVASPLGVHAHEVVFQLCQRGMQQSIVQGSRIAALLRSLVTAAVVPHKSLVRGLARVMERLAFDVALTEVCCCCCCCQYRSLLVCYRRRFRFCSRVAH
jgi:hypothetical protein